MVKKNDLYTFSMRKVMTAVMKNIFLVLMMFHGTLVMAGNPEKKTLKKARTELSKGNYDKSKVLYQELLNLAPDNPEYHFETGLAFYNSNFEKEKSLTHFQNALANSKKDTIAEIFYYLGRANQYLENFEEAKKNYNDFKDFLAENNKGVVLNRDVDRFIQMCNNGITYSNNVDKNVTIINLGPTINTRGAEYAPVIKQDGSLLLYTGRKGESTGGRFYHDNKEYEDIFTSRFENEAWTNSTKFDSSNVYISKDINSKWHDAAIAFNEAEDKLYIYRKNHVWVSEINNGKWKAPVKMNKNVNSRGHEPSVFITPDETTLYVVSTDRKGGVGGRDIWVSKKDGDEWGEMELLKGNINTEFDEDAPFLTKDGKTMYFSSNGHTTMGGYDIFKTELQSDGTWSDPVNLGAPINTAGDDIYYVSGGDSTVAYYSSSRNGGYGDMDIYFIELECKSIPQTEIKGLLLAGEKQFPIGAEIVVYDAENNEVSRTNTDPETGHYLLVLKPEQTYRMEVKADQPYYVERNHKEEFTLPKQCDPFPLYQEIAINRIKNEEGKEYAQEALFQNAFFNVEDSVRSLYNIAGMNSELKEMPEDSLQLNIAGNLMFNDVLSVSEDAKVYLINSRNEIVRIAQTNKYGDFNFRNLNPEESYIVAMDEQDLKYMYYGSNSDNGLIVKGHVEKAYSDPTMSTVNMQDIAIYFLDDSKKVSNHTKTDSLGNFILDNLPQTPVNIDQTFAYNIDSKEIDYAASALIHTINTDNSINYTEVVDLIEWDPNTPPDGDSLLARKFENIYFDFDKYFLRSKSKEILDDIYAFMSSNPDVKIQIDGHTDWYGTNQYNDVLSKNRSKKAFDYLVAKGIDKSRMTSRWHGETMPAQPNANPDGSDNKDNRQLNRRVEFKLSTIDMAYTFSM